MILPSHRKIAHRLVKIGLWKLVPADLWPIPIIHPCFGTKWLHKRMLKMQTRDGLHHAPACPGNEWSGMYLVIMGCNCGAARAERERLKPAPPMPPVHVDSAAQAEVEGRAVAIRKWNELYEAKRRS